MEGRPLPAACLRRRLPDALIALALSLLVVAALSPVLSAGFVQWDDTLYVTENPRVTSGLSVAALRWALTTAHAGNWHPVTWLAHQLDVTCFGLDPRGHHLSSLLLHALNAVLLFAVLRAYTGSRWRSACVAALFGVHPLHVESVAWVSERKDVLAATFFFLSLLAYRRYARAPRALRLAPVATLFALGLAAKPMLVTLPFVLLLLDGWPLGRLGAGRGRADLRRALGEKLPLLLLSLASSAVTLSVQRPSMVGIELHPLGLRLANAVVSYARYLGKTLEPAELSSLVLLPAGGWPAWQVAAAAALFVALGGAALLQLRRHPQYACGGLWFVGTLVPVIGLVQVGRQALADRYTYLPLIGLFVAAVWGAGEAMGRSRRLAAATAAATALVVAGLALAARSQATVWRDDLTLFGHAVAIDPGNWLAQNNLGTALARGGRTEEALARFRLAVEAQPAYEKAWFNIGHTLEMRGRFEEAVPYLTRALALKPDYASASASLGAVLLELGRDAEAGQHLMAAWRLEPGRAGVARNLAVIRGRFGDAEGAQQWQREALRLEAAATPGPGSGRRPRP